MEISNEQMKAFYETVRSHGFTKAAEVLGITQSALSHRIRNLEETLQTVLIIRDPAGVRLTEAGNKLFQFCRVQSQMEEEFLQELQRPKDQELNGFLRIGGASTVLWSAVAPAIAPLIKKNPSIQLEMLMREISELPQLLQTGRVDFIVTCGKVEHHQLEGIHLGDEQNVLVAAKGISARRDVYLDHDSKDRTTIEYLKFQGSKLKNIKRSFMDDIHGILAGVEAGFGVAVVPLHLLKGRKGLQIVEGEKIFQQPVYLHYLRQPFYSRLHTAVIDTLKQEIGKQLRA